MLTQQQQKDNRLFKVLIIALIVTMLLLCSRMTTYGQSSYKYIRHPNAIYLAFQPADLGVGIRYDYHIKDLGLYSSISYGDLGIYRHYGVRHHTKLTTGVLLPLRDYGTGNFDVTAGINYHHIGSIIMDGLPINPKIINPWSFELGLSVKLKRFALAIRTDILRWEPCVDIGIPLKYRR